MAGIQQSYNQSHNEEREKEIKPSSRWNIQQRASVNGVSTVLDIKVPDKGSKLRIRMENRSEQAEAKY